MTVRRGRRAHPDRRRLVVPGHVDRRSGDPGVHQQPGQPRRHGRSHSTTCRRCCGTPNSAARSPTCGPGVTHRGTQLHRLADAAGQWHHRYGQAAWMRQIDIDVTTEMEDSIIETVAELDGRTFPATRSLATRVDQGSGPSAHEARAAVLRRGRGDHLRTDGAARQRHDHRTGTTPASSGAATDCELNGATLGPEIAVTDIPPFELDT